MHRAPGVIALSAGLLAMWFISVTARAQSSSNQAPVGNVGD
jgi:hypothetical protein